MSHVTPTCSYHTNTPDRIIGEAEDGKMNKAAAVAAFGCLKHRKPPDHSFTVTLSVGKIPYIEAI